MTKEILLKKYFNHNNLGTILLYSFLLLFSFSGNNVYAQEKELPSIFNNNDHYYYYQIDTIERTDEIFKLPNPYSDTSFLIYSISKMWDEDTCGHKGYRINLVQFLQSKIKDENLVLYKKDIIYYFGKPYDVLDSVYSQKEIQVGDSLKVVLVPQFNTYTQTIRYPIVKDRDCKNIKEFVEFRIDRKNDEIYSIVFSSDFFETETDVQR